MHIMFPVGRRLGIWAGFSAFVGRQSILPARYHSSSSHSKDVAIADVACGHGALLRCLRESGYRNLRGVDVSTEQVALAHKQGVVEAQCGEMSGFLLDKTGAFEVVFLMDILEHLERGELLELLGLVNRSLNNAGG